MPSSTVKKRSNASISHRSPSQISTPFGINCIALSFSNANARTLSPCSINCLQMVPPKNPVAPVTKYFLFFMFFSFLSPSSLLLKMIASNMFHYINEGKLKVNRDSLSCFTCKKKEAGCIRLL